MTNREKIAEMKVVDFFARYYYVKEPCFKHSFEEMLFRVFKCERCPIKCGNKKYPNECIANLEYWLDKEVSE